MEPVAPERIGKHHHVIFAGCVFLRKKRTAQFRRNPQHVKEIRGSPAAGNLLRFAVAGQRHIEGLDNRDIVERVAFALPDAEIRQVGGKRGIGLAQLRDDFAHQVKLLRLAIGKRPQQHAVHHRENGGVGADAEREREHRYGGEAGILAQHAQTIANIHEKVLKCGPLPDFAAALLDLEDVAKLPPGGEGRFFPRHAAGHQLIDFFRQVLFDLRGKVAVKTTPREQLFDPIHGSPRFKLSAQRGGASNQTCPVDPSSMCAAFMRARSVLECGSSSYRFSRPAGGAMTGGSNGGKR